MKRVKYIPKIDDGYYHVLTSGMKYDVVSYKLNIGGSDYSELVLMVKNVSELFYLRPDELDIFKDISNEYRSDVISEILK